MAKIVVVTGHSWARNLADSERSNQIAPNGGFDRRLHEIRYISRMPGTMLLARTDHIMGDLGVFYQTIGVVELVVVILGTNNLAFEPSLWKQWADAKVQIGRQLSITVCTSVFPIWQEAI